MTKSLRATASNAPKRPDTHKHEGVPLTRLYEAHAYAAYLVVKYGVAYLPIFDRLDRDVAIARANGSGVERARQTLAAYDRDGSFTPPDSGPEGAQ